MTANTCPDVPRYLTGAEIAYLWNLPTGTVRWFAHRDQWRRSEDGRKPVLYNATDVRKTMKTTHIRETAI